MLQVTRQPYDPFAQAPPPAGLAAAVGGGRGGLAGGAIAGIVVAVAGGCCLLPLALFALYRRRVRVCGLWGGARDETLVVSKGGLVVWVWDLHAMTS